MKFFILLFLLYACGNSINQNEVNESSQNASDKYKCTTGEQQ